MALKTDDEILGLLSSGGSWTAASMAQELKVSVRTVRRAIVRLRDQHVVIDADSGPGGGIRLGKHSALPRINLKSIEALDLLLALALAETLNLPLMGSNISRLRKRLSATLVPDQRREAANIRRRILVGAQASEHIRNTWKQPDRTSTVVLQESFLALNRIDIEYTDSDNKKTKRQVEPHYLLMNYPAWYLVAFDLTRNAGRTFRVDRISRVKASAEHFKLRPLNTLSDGLDQWFNPL
jgi:predicted DNA-binding transcriptional regulator YafY